MTYWSNYKTMLIDRKAVLQRWYNDIADSLLPYNYARSYPAWIEFKDTKRYPDNGGRDGQPAWLLADFAYYDLLSEYHALPAMIDECVKQMKSIRR